MYPKFSHMDFNISMALNLATKRIGNLINKTKFLEFMSKYIDDLKSKLCPIENEENEESVKLTTEKSEEKCTVDCKVNSNDNTDVKEIVKEAAKENRNYNNDIVSKKFDKIDYNLFVNDELYTSKSKIIFSGLGADEFFGGYSRYKGSFTRGGYEELAKEMSKDIDRIWMRNFGRDDRVCSDNGIELRFPFFDYNLITYLKGIPHNYITDFELSKRGIGEKILLRKIIKKAGFE